MRRKGTVIAVVVTYNRIDLLRRTVDCLRKNEGLSAILVVNNESTDGTADWLATQPGLTVINQANVGGAGGFHTGIKQAFEMGAEWIWCMDDDVFPRHNCLQELLTCAEDPSVGILAPRRLMNGNIFTNDFIDYNLSNPFSSMYKGKISKRKVTVPIEIKGTAFEGPLIRSEVVESVGLPNKDLFIFCDDTDYCLRTTLAGYKIMYVPSALMDKYKFFSNDTWSSRNRKKKWKRFYQVRNSAYLNHHYGRNAAVRHLRGFINVAGLMLTATLTCPFCKAYHWGDIPNLWQAYRDGVNEKLGNMAK